MVQFEALSPPEPPTPPLPAIPPPTWERYSESSYHWKKDELVKISTRVFPRAGTPAATAEVDLVWRDGLVVGSVERDELGGVTTWSYRYDTKRRLVSIDAPPRGPSTTFEYVCDEPSLGFWYDAMQPP